MLLQQVVWWDTAYHLDDKVVVSAYVRQSTSVHSINNVVRHISCVRAHSTRHCQRVALSVLSSAVRP